MKKKKKRTDPKRIVALLKRFSVEKKLRYWYIDFNTKKLSRIKTKTSIPDFSDINFADITKTERINPLIHSSVYDPELQKTLNNMTAQMRLKNPTIEYPNGKRGLYLGKCTTAKNLMHNLGKID